MGLDDFAYSRAELEHELDLVRKLEREDIEGKSWPIFTWVKGLTSLNVVMNIRG